VIAGREQATSDFGLEVGLIAGLARELGAAACQTEAEVFAAYAGRGLVGIDLLGNEIDFPAEWFAPIFLPIARQGQLGITVHAGEAAGAESVRAAVESLGATRIGHGIRAQEDPAVVALLKDRAVTLEMCPTSNVQTGAAPDLDAHPLARFLRAGLSVTINTDDPQISRIDLVHEYELAATALGLSRAEILKTLYYAVAAAFTTDQIKARLWQTIQTWEQSELAEPGSEKGQR
jgi:adenosine deaminase